MTDSLEDIRVLDLSKVLAGPLCAQWLGDLGADVIKVEAVGLGDDTRDWPPFRRTPNGQRAGAVFLSANRNKRSIAVNLRDPQGLEIVQRLARRADVVIESFGPGVAAKLGVDSDSLRKINPRIIHCSITGFGSVGPMSGAKGYDMILQAFSGMISITGEPGGGPVRSPFSPVDQATGSHALSGILAALYARERTGLGKSVEASLFDTAMAFLAYSIQSFWESGQEPKRPGAGHESLCPYDAFPTADKPLILGIANDGLWMKFCELAELTDISADPRFHKNSDRVANRTSTSAIVREALSHRKRDEWIAILERNGIPCAPIHTLAEVTAHPHFTESGMVQSYEHGTFGQIHTIAMPLRFDKNRTPIYRGAPMHGENCREILIDIGYTNSEIKALTAGGVIANNLP